MYIGKIVWKIFVLDRNTLYQMQIIYMENIQIDLLIKKYYFYYNNQILCL